MRYFARRDPNIYLRDIAMHVPRLRHLLWSGYAREASETVMQMLAQLHRHAGLHNASGKIGRLYELINNPGS
ncbi:hypothetical protein RTCIAT899_PC01025 (plasmid) [Rhizobium tropici CIAT 899]|nr:hypothetical protein RTCIAT899_PC01025 [Rhizobium tropici CIAT 899]